MKDRWERRALALLGGGLAGVYYLDFSPGVKKALFAALVLALLAAHRWKPQDFWGKVYKPEVVLLAATAVTGFIYGLIAVMALPQPMVIDGLKVEGTILDIKKKSDRWETVLLLTDAAHPESAGIALNGKYLLYIYPDRQGEWPEAWQELRPGDRVATTVRLEWVKPKGTAGGVDPQLYYYVQGLKGKLKLRGDTVLLERGEAPLTWRIRDDVAQELNRFHPEWAGIFEGIVFGDTANISDEAAEIYRVAGVWHVFAASGSNVAFVLALSYFLFRYLPPPLRIGFTVAMLILYALLCGGNAPIVRATILGIAALGGMLGKGKLAGTRLLWLAGAGMFVFKPLWIKDIGFQLSFAASWGIMALSPYLLKTRLLYSMPALLRTAAAVAFAAQIAVFPLLILAFHRVSLIGIVTNVFILFVLGAVLELGLIGVILTPLGILAVPFFQVGIWLIQLADALLRAMVSFPWSEAWVVNPGLPFVLCWYLAIGVLLVGRHRAEFVLTVYWRKLRRWLPLNHEKMSFLGEKFSLKWVALGLLLLLLLSPWTRDDVLRVSFIDVGQGDAILIEGPGGRALLVDTGPAYDDYNAGESVVLPYLLHKGIKRLEGLILTHEHLDHTGGVTPVLARMPVNWVGIPDTGGEVFEEGWEGVLPSAYLENAAKLITLREGDRINLGDRVTLDVIAPSGHIRGTRSDANNNSVVLRVRYGAMDVLLTGDVELEGLAEIADNGWLGDGKIEVLKVPHHGSRYSFDPLIWDEVHPELAVITVGSNAFGHPAPEVVEYWQERGVPVYRTDYHGTVEVEIDGTGIYVKSGRRMTGYQAMWNGD